MKRHPRPVLTLTINPAKTDYLMDFKSNLIMGHMISGGTGFRTFKTRISKYLDKEEETEVLFDFADSVV